MSLKSDAEVLQDIHSAKSSQSSWPLLTGEAKRRAVQSVSKAVEKVTRWFRIKRADLWVAAGM